jgi:hypothetical protein
MLELFRWLKWVAQWVEKLLSQFRKPSLQIVEERLLSRDELSEAKRIKRDTPGAINTWYISHNVTPNQLLITLDNLAEIRIAIAKERKAAQKAGKPYTPSIVELSLTAKDRINRTHRVGVQWLIKLNTRTLVTRVGVWDADLQGNSLDPNAAAETIIRLAVREILNLTPIPSIPWRTRLTHFPWEQTLEAYSRAVISENHQPYIKRLRAAKKSKGTIGRRGIK